MAKNATFRFFEKQKPDAIIPAFANWAAPPTREPIHRLSWLNYEIESTWEKYAEDVESGSMPDSVFVLDSSFFGRRDIPEAAWNAIFSRKLLFTPEVWKELEPLRGMPFANRAFIERIQNELQNQTGKVAILNSDSWDDSIKASASYYIALLGARKLIGHQLLEEFKGSQGREPSQEELQQILQLRVRDRGLVLARKGMDSLTRENLFADEELVVLSIFNAILTGHETTILTRDGDVFEQFYKALYLIDTHYRSRLIADAYKRCPENFIELAAEPIGDASSLFDGDISILQIPRHFSEWVLPTQWRGVNVYCHRLTDDGEKVKATILTFHAEREMQSLLSIKGKNGRNTHALGDRNCHTLISPPFMKQLGGDVIFSNDKIYEFGNFRGPLLELEYSLQQIEGFRRIEIIQGGAETKESLGCKLADFRIVDRMTFSSPPEWKTVPNSEISKAIDLFDPAAIFFCDFSFLTAAIDQSIEQALLSKGITIAKSTIRHLAASSQEERRSAIASAAFEPNRKAINICDNEALLSGVMGISHYYGLLTFRKLFYLAIQHELKRRSGHEPSCDEFLSRIEEVAGVHGGRLAEEGVKRKDDPTLFFGDETLVLAIHAALFHGADVVLCTSDAFMLEQFQRLCLLISSDYAAFAFGKNAASEIREAARKIEEKSAPPELHKVYESAVLSLRLDDTWKNAALPSEPYLINIHLWLFGKEHEDGRAFAALTFCAERPMYDFLNFKGRSNGKNISDSSGANLRISYADPSGMGATAILGRDRMVSKGTSSFPADPRVDLRFDSIAAFDLMRAVHQHEQNWDNVWQELMR